MQGLTVLDLFSGIGGFSRGLELTGRFDTVAFCESEPFCRAILRKQWPGIPVFPDIRSLSLRPGFADVVCGGFPCQNISVAGKQGGINGEHSGLWKEFKRIIKEVHPAYAVIENVAALRGNGLVTVLQDLWEIGYDAEWNIISAAEVGAPHLRERIWIVAYPCRQGSQGESGTQPEDTEPPGLGGGQASTYSDERGLETPRPEQQAAGVAGCPEEEMEMAVPDPGGIGHSRRFLGTQDSETVRYHLRYWDKIEPPVCGVDDGLPPGLDGADNHRGLKALCELERKERVKALGNSIVPVIATLIGRAIVEDLA